MKMLCMNITYSLIIIWVISNENVFCQITGFYGNESGIPDGVKNLLIFLKRQQNDFGISQRTSLNSERSKEKRGGCGLTPLIQETKTLIYGGTNTSIGEWPWHGALYYVYNGTTEYKCGCTLIHESRVVTAAHCVQQGNTIYPATDIQVSFGSYLLNKPDSSRTFKKVNEIKIHPNYSTVYSNDIAILMLQTKVNFNDFIQPACLWTGPLNEDQTHVEGKNGTVIGWGLIDAQNTPEILQKVELPVVYYNRCYDEDLEFFDEHLNSNNFCAGIKNTPMNACKGDSGGGMFFKEKGNDSISRWYLGGVVSLSRSNKGRTSCDLSMYTLYTLVENFYNFIQE